LFLAWPAIMAVHNFVFAEGSKLLHRAQFPGFSLQAFYDAAGGSCKPEGLRSFPTGLLRGKASE